jgi:hypothetical protein
MNLGHLSGIPGKSFSYSVFRGKKDNQPKRVDGTLQSFIEEIFDPTRIKASKDNCPLFQCVVYKDGATRGNSGVAYFTGITGDYDLGKVKLSVAANHLRTRGIFSILYQSFSSEAGFEKWRLIVPTKTKIEKDDFRNLLGRVNAILGEVGVELSSESFVVGQAFYYGFNQAALKERDTADLTEIVGGELLDHEADWFTEIDPVFPILVAKEHQLGRRLFPDEVEAEIQALADRVGGKIGTGGGRTPLLLGYLKAYRWQNDVDLEELIAKGEEIADRYFLDSKTTMNISRVAGWVHEKIVFEPRTQDIAQAFKDAPDDSDDNPNPATKKKKSFQETEVIFGDREEPIEYIVDGFFESGVGVLAGAPGGGKTNAMVPFSLIAAGLLEAPGLRAELRRKVVYISEHPSQVGRILKSIKKANPGIDKAELRDWFKVFPSARRSLSEVAKILEVVKAEYSYTDACGYLVRPLVIFDTASACFNLENENDNSQVAEVIATLKAANIPILVVAHTPKALKRADLDQLTVRGGGAWEGDAHQVFFLFEDEAIGRRVIGISKVRFLPAFWEIHFGLSEPFDEIVEVPWDGQAQRVTFVHGVPEIGSREERQEARAELAEERRDDKKEKAILEKMGQVLSVVESTVGRGAWISRGLLREVIGGRTETLVTVISRLVGAGSVEEIEIPESIHKSGGTKPKALIPAGLNQESYWARVAEIARGKAGT